MQGVKAGHTSNGIEVLKKIAFLLCRGFRLSGASVFAECAQHVHCTVMVSHGMQVGKIAFQALKSQRKGLIWLTHWSPLTTYGTPGQVWLHQDSTRFPMVPPFFFGDPPADPLGTQCSMCRLFRTGRLEDQPAGNL